MRDACAAIEASDEIPSLDALATRAGYSRFHFLRLFRDHTGLTPRAYAEGVRARKLGASLAGQGTRVADAVADAGFGSESRVYEKTGALLGMTPGAARRGGAGEIIRTASADCAFGRLLVGATGKGVCFIGFAEPDEALLADLRRRFPRARIEADDAALAGTVRAVLQLLEEPKQALGLPLDLRGTAFQQLVWRTLTRIPPGRDPQLRRSGGDGRQPACRARGGTVLRGQPGSGGRAVSPRGGQRRRIDRLSLGPAAQARPAGARGRCTITSPAGAGEVDGARAPRVRVIGSARCRSARCG